MKNAFSEERNAPTSFLEREREDPGNEVGGAIGHFGIVPSLCSKARLRAKLLICKYVLILMQIKLIFIYLVLHLALYRKCEK